MKSLDVLAKMMTYSLITGGAVFLAVKVYLLLQPVPQREKIIKHTDVLTRKPERLQPKNSDQ